MSCFKILTVGILFAVVRTSDSQTVAEETIPPLVQKYIDNEMKRIEYVLSEKVKEITETFKKENVKLKLENNLLIAKLNKERRNTSKQIRELKNEQKEIQKRFTREMKEKDLMLTELRKKTREIDALKNYINALQLGTKSTNRTHVYGDHFDTDKSKMSENAFKHLVTDTDTDFVEGEASKDENGIDWNKELPVDELCDRCKGKQRSVRMLNPSSSTHVAFFARLSKITPQLAPNQDVVFDHVVTNVGNGYHGNHGLFVAPVSGLYVFSATVMAYLPGTTLQIKHAKLVKNGQVLARLGQHGVSVWDSSTMMIAVQLQKGDDVAVQNSDYNNVTFWGDDYSSFSGFLLYETASSPNLVGK